MRSLSFLLEYVNPPRSGVIHTLSFGPFMSLLASLPPTSSRSYFSSSFISFILHLILISTNFNIPPHTCPTIEPSTTNTRNGSTSSSTVEARRIRKRELDRHAQRCARQRTKDRIAFLEERLEESYRAEPGQRRVAALLDELAAVKQQRDELMSIVSSIQKTLVGVSTSTIQHTSPPAIPSPATQAALTSATPPAPAPVDEVEPIVPLPEVPCHCINDAPSASTSTASRNIWRSVSCTLTKSQQLISTPSPKYPTPSSTKMSQSVQCSKAGKQSRKPGC